MTDKLTIPQAAIHFDVSERTIRRWLQQGKLETDVIDGQRYVIVTKTDMVVSEVDHLKALLTEKEYRLTCANAEINRMQAQVEAQANHMEHLAQLLAIQSKTTAALTEQLDTFRQIRSQRHWWHALMFWR